MASVGRLASGKSSIMANNQGYFGGCIPTRYMVAGVAFLNFTYIYMLRLNVNIAIVTMVNYTAIPHVDRAVTNAECQLPESANDSAAFDQTQQYDSSPDGEFVWNENLQALVSVSFFWAYAVVQLFSGRLAERIGVKYLFAAAQILSAVATLCIPVLARQGIGYMIVGRVLVGFAQGVCIPVAQPLVANWTPKEEKSRISTFIVSGGQIGTIVGIPLSGYLADTYGWEAVFYVEGLMGVFFIGAWLLVIEDSPAQHSRISDQEKAYIEAGTTASADVKKLPVPWRCIVRSVPCWALLIATMGNNWAFYVILTELPIYMKNILHFDTKTNALLTGSPYALMWIVSMLMAQLADLLVNKRWCTLNFIRKFSNTIGHGGQAVCLIIVAFLGCNRFWTLILLYMAISCQGAIYSGFLINQLDLAPNYAGTIYGITNGISSVNSCLAPLVVAALTDAQQTLARWRIAFLLTAAILLLDNTIFVMYGSTDEQPWNRPKPLTVTDPEINVKNTHKSQNKGQINGGYDRTDE